MLLAILNKVQHYIAEQDLFPNKTPLLIAVSGGSDSLAACHILNNLGYPVGLAHCNFKLRGNEADDDQKFVKAYAEAHQFPFFSIDFETEKLAIKAQVSIQVMARNLRYKWLEKVRKENGFHFIITAHHQKDSVETVLLNLVNGSGLKGLQGIPIKNEKVVRPLLSLSKEDIQNYISKNGIKYREDASNKNLKYKRNFIRHEVIPVLEKINPQVVQHIHGLSERAKEAKLLAEERIQQIKRKIVFKKYNAIEIKYGYVLNHPAGKTILYELLKPFHFNSEQALEIYNNLKSNTGSAFLSSTHKIIKDRNSLFVLDLKNEDVTIQQFEKLPNQIVFANYKIKVDQLPIQKCTIKKSSNYAYFDASTLEFPLTIRTWKAGDYFYPYGLTKQNSDKVGKKKLSKYFKDEKVSAYDKMNLPILFSGEKTLWLVGQRIDHRFRVTEETKEVVKMKVVAK